MPPASSSCGSPRSGKLNIQPVGFTAFARSFAIQKHWAGEARGTVAGVHEEEKEQLTALIPSGPALILNTIRRAGEVRAMSELKRPADGEAAASLKTGDLKMAAQLISTMSGNWKPAD